MPWVSGGAAAPIAHPREAVMALTNSAVSTPPGWELVRQGGGAALRLSGDWIARATGVRSDGEVRRLVQEAGVRQIRLDVGALGRWDSALIAFLMALRDAAAAGVPAPIALDETALPDAAQRLLALAAEPTGEAEAEAAAVPRRSLVRALGQLALARWSELVVMAGLIGLTALRGGAALGRRAYTRAVDIVQLAREAGIDALGIVAIVNGLVGAILAFVGAVQLRRFGAGIYVADLVGIATVREMAAIMTAIVMAGRTGGAYAAHIATMQGNEEIDALKALGIPVFDFLVLPRMIALVAMMPLLYLYACALGLFGGYLVAIATLDISSSAFLEQLRGAVLARQFAIGLTKSVSFGALVALAGCHIGLQAGRSAADVGHAATTAVVAGIVGIIALDAIFAVCTNALGI